jgi:sec-independent protein translocase protein TatB
MFDVGWSELVVIGVVALVVIGPKELPGVLRTVGKAAGKLRTMAGEFRTQFDDAMREAELHEVKKTFDDAASSASSAMAATTDPLSTIRDEVKASVEEIRNEGMADEGAVATPPPAKSETISAIEADAGALEAEIAAEPVKKPRTRRKKTTETAGDEA